MKTQLTKAQLQRINILKAIAKHKTKQEPTKQTFSLDGWNKETYQKWFNNKLKNERNKH